MSVRNSYGNQTEFSKPFNSKAAALPSSAVKYKVRAVNIAGTPSFSIEVKVAC